jgi:hypothetical protein
MENITTKIKDAISQNILWSINVFFDFIEKIRCEDIEVSYWDGEENWATLIIDKKPIGYLWKKYPLLFIQRNYLNKVKIVIENCKYLSSVTVDDLNAEVLKLDYDDLKDHLEYGEDYGKFSATDLWFQTNSI